VCRRSHHRLQPGRGTPARQRDRHDGLTRVEVTPIDIATRFTSFDDYWRPFLGGQGPAGAYVASLPEARRAALEARLRARLLGGRSNGPITLPARAWAVKGVVPE